MEVEAQRCAIAVVVTIEVMTQKSSELFATLHVRARINHVTTGKRLVESGVVTTIQLVHDHLPDWVTTRRAVVSVSVALVWHAEVQCIRPNWHSSQRCRDRCVINEELIGHHFELFIATDTQIWSTNADDAAVSNVGKAFDNQTGASHLCQPVVVGSLRPVFRVVFVGQREDGDFMSASVQVLHGRVICVLVRDEESSPDLAAVGILPLAVEEVFVQVDVVDVNGPVKRDRNHLGHLRWLDVAGNAGAVGGTEAVGQDALRCVAIWRSIGIGFHA